MSNNTKPLTAEEILDKHTKGAFDRLVYVKKSIIAAMHEFVVTSTLISEVDKPLSTKVLRNRIKAKHDITDTEFINWWAEQQIVIDYQMRVFSKEERIQAAKSFEDLAKIILQMNNEFLAAEDSKAGNSAAAQPK